jgi:hypothetical protein
VVSPQNHWDGFLRFGLKTGGDGFSNLASKSVATISPSLTSKPVVGFLLESQNQVGEGFSGLDLKTDSYDLVNWVSKSLRRFFGLCLKTNRTTICRLRHKSDGRMESVWGTRRDLGACFAWKQVGLGFSSLASRLLDAQHGWCTWHHYGGYVEVKLKTYGSIRWAISDPTTFSLLFSLYYALGVF